MSTLSKIGLSLALLGISFAGGLFVGRGQKSVTVVEGKTIVKEVEKVVTVTKIIRPDGTVEETTKTEEKQTDTKTKEKSKATTAAQLAQYGVGGGVRARFGQGLQSPEYYGTVSRRMLGPAWLELQGSKESVALGVRVEF